MKCPKCNEEMDEDSSSCRRCSVDDAEVKVLRPDERDDFKGLTIQQNGNTADEPEYREDTPGNYEYRSEGPGHRVYVRQVSFGSKPFGFLTKLVIAAMILFFIFVALPVALVLMAVFSIVWWLVRR
ncbi:MAG TPA: hypothetical protein VN631_15555 [Negativicutes bacterium]|nr:hypothetical protein [Negativicutes bacterium]